MINTFAPHVNSLHSPFAHSGKTILPTVGLFVGAKVGLDVVLEIKIVGKRVGDLENVGAVGARVGRFERVGFLVGITGEAVGRIHLVEAMHFPFHSHPLMEAQVKYVVDKPQLFFIFGAT